MLLDPPDDLSVAQLRTRNRLLRAAASHFARFGYRRANIADIAAEAGIGKGTLYLFFESKIALLVACVAQEKLELIPQLERALERAPAERLEAYLEIAIRFAISAPLSSAIVKGDYELSAALADAAKEGLPTDPTEGMALVSGLVADAAPGMPEDECDRLAQVLVIVSTLPAHLQSLQQLTELSNEDFITSYTRVLARGVANYNPSTTESA